MEFFTGLAGQSIATLITAFAGLVTTVIAVTKYLSRRDKMIAARNVFRTVVESLSSESEIQRLGGAVLLRRFFDPHTELGIGNTPYASEAIDVIAAILREVETGNFQKLLADGLRYAPNLENVDLQRTNLQKAYLGKKDGRMPNLKGADFYRADLSGASLKGANASGAIFYQARLHNTVFKNTGLSESYFFEADLIGSNFEGAYLYGANFKGARNIPTALLEDIGEDGTYKSHKPVQVSATSNDQKSLTVFLSKPGTLNAPQRKFVRELNTILENEDVKIETVERENYPGFGSVSEVRRVMSGCSGAVVLGFRQLEIRDGVWRDGTNEARDIKDMAFPSAWNHVESGMAAMTGLPILFIIEQGMVGGLFELEDIDHVVTYLDLRKPDYQNLNHLVSTWCNSVRETLH